MSALSDADRARIAANRERAMQLQAAKRARETAAIGAPVAQSMATNQPVAQSISSNQPMAQSMATNQPVAQPQSSGPPLAIPRIGSLIQRTSSMNCTSNTTTAPVPQPTKASSGGLTAEQEAIRARNREMALARRAAAMGQTESGSSSSTTSTIESRPPVKPTPPPTIISPIFRSSIECTIAIHNHERFKVIFRPFHSCITTALRRIPSRVYEEKERINTFTFSDYDRVLKALSEITEVNITVLTLPANVVRILTTEDSGGRTKSNVNPTGDLTSGIDPELVQVLFPYQRKGVLFGISKNGRLLVADEMGLGKSIQALAIARYYRHNWPLVIVCPSSVKSAWKGQIRKFLPAIKENLFVMEKEKEPLPDPHTSNTVLIMSYDFMMRREEDLKNRNYKSWIFDESHYLKDFKAKRTKAAWNIASKATHVILLSGTPALSRPSELYPQIKIIDPRLFPKQNDFFVRYCDAKETRWGLDAKGSTNAEELSAILMKRLMIRRLKADVLTDLPEKRREIVYLSCDSIASRVESSRANSARNFDRFNPNDESLLEYYTHTGTAKARPVCDHIIDNFFYEGADETRKALIFAHHTIVLDTISVVLAQKGIKYIRIDGSTASAKRGELCHDFQEDPEVRVAVLSITAAGQGITLTAASVVVFAEIYWIPGALLQAEDRAHRVGQKDSVFVQYMLARNTADDLIWPMVQNKLTVLQQVKLNSESFSDAERKHTNIGANEEGNEQQWDIEEEEDKPEPKPSGPKKMRF